MKQLMSSKAKEKKQEEIVVMRHFPEVFPDDLSGLPPISEIKFRIELILRAMLVAKSPYRLAPSELEEQDKMSRDVITVGSTMRILLLYQVSLTGNAQNAPPTLKDLKFWTAEVKKTRKIDRLARSLLIQGLPNDIYSFIDSNETTKDLWDALERKMRGSESKPTNNNLRTSSTSQSANKKQEFVKMNDKKVEKKDDEKKRDMSKVKCYNYKKEGHFAKDCKKAKVKDYNYYKTKMLLAKKDSDEQVLLAKDQAWMESSSDSDQEINANMVFIA
nr:putative reverse transcriptase domain-containing protein [Tanacetum cinerariifolium]